MPISKSTKEKWFQQIKSDYGHLHDDMIETILDVYDSDQDWIHEKIKDLKKNHKGPLSVKTQLTLEELERINEIAEEKREEIEKNFTFGIIRNEEEN